MTEYCDRPRPHVVMQPADDPAALDLAVETLAAGGVVAFPTDTVYGIGADARRPAAVAELYIIKRRPPDKAIPLLVASLDDALPFVSEVPEAARALITAFWPGALTLVLPIAGGVPPIISAGPGIAVRMPDHPVPLALIRRLGAPLASTSANLSGAPAPLDAGAVAEQLGRRVDLILDGGRAPGGQASTVVDLSVQPARLLRLGPISAEHLRIYLPDLVVVSTS
jgi:L-threonylcarbamoyladenylate synthase